MNLLLRAFALGDVTKNGHVIIGATIFGQYTRHGHTLRIRFAIFAQAHNFALPGFFPHQGFKQGAIKARHLLAAFQGCQFFTQHLIRRITGHAAKRVIDANNPPMLIGDDNPLLCFKGLCRNAQFLLGLAQIRHIVKPAEHGRFAAIFQPQIGSQHPSNPHARNQQLHQPVCDDMPGLQLSHHVFIIMMIRVVARRTDPDDGCQRHIQHTGIAPIGKLHPLIDTGHHAYRNGTGLQHVAQAFLIAANQFFRLAACRHIPTGRPDVWFAIQPHRGGIDFDREATTVAAAMRCFHHHGLTVLYQLTE